MTHHDGDIVILTAEDAQRYANIANVGGRLYISADVQLPALTNVGGWLDIRADAQLPALTSVGGHQSTQPVTTLRRQWTVVIGDTYMQIGCETHPLADWAAFDDERINYMDTGALRFWREHKDALLALAAARTAKEAA